MTRHLVHIGYPKAGSTWLQRWFEAHPQLAYGEGAIAGFRDVYSIARAAANADAGIRYRVTSYEGLSAPRADAGRNFVDYERLRELDAATAQVRVCTLLGELFPNAVILIVTRGFRSMILSSYSQYVRSGGAADLDALVELAKRGPGAPGYDTLADLARWNYDELIAAYRAKFGAENVIVMPYELLRDDAREFTRTLANRLGIDDFITTPARVNESLSPVELRWYPRLTRAMRRIPSRRLFDLYIRAAFRGRLGAPIRMLDRLRPAKPVTAASIPDEVLDGFRGHAESLRADPLYAPWLADYCLTTPTDTAARARA